MICVTLGNSGNSCSAHKHCIAVAPQQLHTYIPHVFEVHPQLSILHQRRQREVVLRHMSRLPERKRQPGNMISTLPFFTRLHLSSSDLWQPESSLPDLLKSSPGCCHVNVRREKWPTRRGRWWGGRCCKGGEASPAGTVFHFTGCKVSLSTLWGIHRNWVTFYQNF